MKNYRFNDKFAFVDRLSSFIGPKKEEENQPVNQQ